MSDNLVYVHLDLQKETRLVGRLWIHMRKNKERASFEYDKSWLACEERFALEPALSLTPGAFHSGVDKSIFGSIGDSAPDRWGRILIRRAHSREIQGKGELPRTLNEIDYLLAVSDSTRQGALRFSRKIDTLFLAHSDERAIPPLVMLPQLLTASERVLGDKESDTDLKLLLAPGSSLGGARPKSSTVDQGGVLSIAKFPRNDDEFSTVSWEAVALSLAKQAGLSTPEWKIITVSNRRILILKRFDRDGNRRIPYLSAMSMIGAKDNEAHSYLEIVDALHQFGATPTKDCKELWKRIIFSILISNTDDHLRNHGFLYDGLQGWQLSPVFDINPTPVEIKPRILTTSIDLENGEVSLDLALSVAHYFGLKTEEAWKEIRNVGKSIANWRKVARKFDISETEINRMASAFEHEDLLTATSR